MPSGQGTGSSPDAPRRPSVASTSAGSFGAARPIESPARRSGPNSARSMTTWRTSLLDPGPVRGGGDHAAPARRRPGIATGAWRRAATAGEPRALPPAMLQQPLRRLGAGHAERSMPRVLPPAPRRSSGTDSRTGRSRAVPSPPSAAAARPAFGERDAAPAVPSPGRAREVLRRPRRRVAMRRLDAAARTLPPQRPARNPFSQARCAGENGAFSGISGTGAATCVHHTVLQGRARTAPTGLPDRCGGEYSGMLSSGARRRSRCHALSSDSTIGGRSSNTTFGRISRPAPAPRRRRRRHAGRSLRPCRRLARPWWQAGRYRRHSAARRNDGSRSSGC